MNIIESFAEWLQLQSVATLGQDLFISRARSLPNAMYWLVAGGGSSGPQNVNTGFQFTHQILVYYRDTDPKSVYDNLHTLQMLVMQEGCLELEDFIVVDVSTTGPFSDQDLDSESRTVGLLQITITTYEE